MNNHLFSYLALFFGVFALSTSAIFVKLAHAPSGITAFYRLFFTFLILLPFLLADKKNWRQLSSLSGKEWGLGLLSGLLLGIHYVLWFESLRYTSTASSTVIVSLQPLFAIAGGFFLFGECLNKNAFIGCAVAIMGCFIIGWGDFQLSSQALFGDLLAFLAAGIITAYFFIGQVLRKKLSVIPYSILGYGSSSLFLALYAIIQRNSFIQYPLQTWAAFLGLALIATIFGQMVFNWLLQWLSATVISIGILGEPVGTCILAYFILHEVISLRQAIGIGIILTGMALFLSQNKISAETAPHE